MADPRNPDVNTDPTKGRPDQSRPRPRCSTTDPAGPPPPP